MFSLIGGVRRMPAGRTAHGTQNFTFFRPENAGSAEQGKIEQCGGCGMNGEGQPNGGDTAGQRLKKQAGCTCCADHTGHRTEYLMPEARAHTGHAEHTGDAQGGVERFRHVNGDDITVQTHYGQENPNQQNGHGGVNDIDIHGINLFPHSFEDGIYRTVHIHDRNQGCQPADKENRLCNIARAGYRTPQLFGKAKHHPGDAHRKKHGQRKNAEGDAADTRGIRKYAALRHLGNQKPGERGDKGGGKQHNG